jgi:hypothetical protein
LKPLTSAPYSSGQSGESSSISTQYPQAPGGQYPSASVEQANAASAVLRPRSLAMTGIAAVFILLL